MTLFEYSALQEKRGEIVACRLIFKFSSEMQQTCRNYSFRKTKTPFLRNFIPFSTMAIYVFSNKSMIAAYVGFF